MTIGGHLDQVPGRSTIQTLVQTLALAEHSMPRSARIPVDALREAFDRSGKSASSVAREMGWIRGDSSRLLRSLGINEYTNGAGRVHRNTTVDLEEALRIADILGLDPVDIGA